MTHAFSLLVGFITHIKVHTRDLQLRLFSVVRRWCAGLPLARFPGGRPERNMVLVLFWRRALVLADQL